VRAIDTKGLNLSINDNKIVSEKWDCATHVEEHPFFGQNHAACFNEVHSWFRIDRCLMLFRAASLIGCQIKCLALVGCFALGACQTTSTPETPAAKQEPRGVSITPSNFKLPEGAGCTGDIARFRAIQANDLETGHTTKPVYDQIEGEMKKAEAMCAGGNSGGASAYVRATKSRFGYP
jgi:hypothetical protein